MMSEASMAHCGIFGNEKADQLAKLGSRMPQMDEKTPYNTAKQIAKSIARKCGTIVGSRTIQEERSSNTNLLQTQEILSINWKGKTSAVFLD